MDQWTVWSSKNITDRVALLFIVMLVVVRKGFKNLQYRSLKGMTGPPDQVALAVTKTGESKVLPHSQTTLHGVGVNMNAKEKGKIDGDFENDKAFLAILIRHERSMHQHYVRGISKLKQQ